MSAVPTPPDDDRPEPMPPGLGVELVRGEIVEYQDTGWSKSAKDHQRQQQQRYKFDDLKKAMYVRLIRQGMGRGRAAEAVGVGSTCVSEHMRKFPDFALAVSEAEMCRVDEVEEALYSTAINGNVVAQQVVLYNKRSDEWADQRLMRSRIEAQAAADERQQAKSAASALEALHGRLGELRQRLTADDEPPEMPDAETDEDEDNAEDDDIEYARLHTVEGSEVTRDVDVDDQPG